MSVYEEGPPRERGFAVWKAQIAKLLSEPFLFSLMIGSILLSVASFYTTYEGMKNFMPQTFIAFCITFAIQALLFVTSWRIGFDFAEKRGWPLFTMFVFATSFCGSVFFSWVALFGAINDEDLQQRTRMTRIHSAVEETIADVRIRAVERRRQAAADLVNSNAYAAWRAEVERVAETALGAGDKLAVALRVKAEERARSLREQEARVATLKADQERGKAALETAQAALERLEERRKFLTNRLATLETEVAEANDAVELKQAEMDAEEAGAAGQGRGRGPIWRGLEEARDQLAAIAAGKARLLQNAQAERAQVDQEMRDARARIGELEARTSAELDTRVAELEAMRSLELGDAQLDLGSKVRAMRENLAAFAARQELEPLDAAAATCTEILTEMRKIPELQGDVAGLTCDRRSMAAELNPIDDATEDLQALQTLCVAGGPQAQVVTTLSFESAIEYGRKCLGLSGLEANEVDDLRGELDRLELEEDPDASAFVKTMNGFLGGEKLAYFALGIAVSIDALVLFSGLIGAQNRGPNQGGSQSGGLAVRLMQVGGDERELDARLARQRLRLILSHIQPARRIVFGSVGALRRWRRSKRGASPEVVVRPELVDDQEERLELERALMICEIDGLCDRVRGGSGEVLYRFGRGALNELTELLEREVRSARPKPASTRRAKDAQMIAEWMRGDTG